MQSRQLVGEKMKTKEALAEAYATGNHRVSFPDTFEMKAFIAGFDACFSQASDSTDYVAGEKYHLDLLRRGIKINEHDSFLAGMQHGRLSERAKLEDCINSNSGLVDRLREAHSEIIKELEQERTRSAALIEALKLIRSNPRTSPMTRIFCIGVVESYEQREK